MEATPSGNDVFFLTAAQLLPQDTDTAFDIYDARVCSQESPCLTVPAQDAPPCTTTEGCRPSSPSEQAPGVSGSAGAVSTGNLPPAGKQEVRDAKSSTKPLTRAQKLANALAACRRQHRHSKKKRQACETHARKLYAPKTKASRKAAASKSAKSSDGSSPGRKG